MYSLAYSPRAEKAITKFPRDYQKLITSKIVSLSENPRPRGYDKIEAANPPLYRVRIGNYRVFYFINDVMKEVLVVDVRRGTSVTYRKRCILRNLAEETLKVYTSV